MLCFPKHHEQPERRPTMGWLERYDESSTPPIKNRIFTISRALVHIDEEQWQWQWQENEEFYLPSSLVVNLISRKVTMSQKNKNQTRNCWLSVQSFNDHTRIWGENFAPWPMYTGKWAGTRTTTEIQWVHNTPLVSPTCIWCPSTLVLLQEKTWCGWWLLHHWWCNHWHH